MTGVRKYDHISTTTEKLQWIRIEERHTYENCIQVFKITNEYTPDWVLKLTTVADRGCTNTRQLETFYILELLTDIGQISIKWNGSTIWNKMLSETKTTKTITGL